jgi:hypothetical protein
MIKRALAIILFLVVCVGGGFLIAKRLIVSRPADLIEQDTKTISEALPDQSQDIQTPADAKKNDNQTATSPKNIQINQKIQYPVPFIVQAPFANWKDPIFQNACEEAALIMAAAWVRGETEISAQEANSRIKNIVDFEDKTLGYNTDTDVDDMQKIFRQHFDYEKIFTRKNIALDDIKNELQKGNIVLVPAFGQKLKNPNYTPPGPVAHMLVIIGYDPDTREFITNDAGTKRGKNYRYDENVLFSAIWEYPSGAIAPQPPKNAFKKVMLVIQPNQNK